MADNTRGNTARAARGRRDALDEARELVSLLGALSSEGDGVSVASISSRLGITAEEARKLLLLIVTAGSESDDYLPLAFAEDSESEVFLAFPRGNRGRPLRLTAAEGIALTAALNYLGVPDDDPLRRHLQTSFGSGPMDAQAIQKTLAPVGDTLTSQNLSTIAACLADSASLTFLYTGSVDSKQNPRRVTPLGTRLDNGYWYLDAYDHDREGDRTFRVDRMVTLAEVDAIPRRHNPTARTQDAPKLVTLRFADERYLNLFDWHGLTIVSQAEGITVGTIPYYGPSSSWLPQHLAACGGAVMCDDAGITAAAREYAQQLMSANGI
jgi:predicted DNA-binding transcriptional regulator YafY